MDQVSEQERASRPFDIREMGAAAREVTTSMTEMVRSEVRLAKAEMKDTATKMGRDVLQIAVFAGIAALGILPFIAFCVIGLGQLLGNNYWLSSLIISAVFFVFGGLLAYRAYAALSSEQQEIMPETTKSLNEEKEVVQRKVHQISEVSKRRSA